MTDQQEPNDQEKDVAKDLGQKMLWGSALFVYSVIGYVISVLLFTTIMAVAMIEFFWLLEKNLEEFSWIVLLIDIAAAIVFIYIATRRKFWKGIAELWQQISKNL